MINFIGLILICINPILRGPNPYPPPDILIRFIMPIPPPEEYQSIPCWEEYTLTEISVYNNIAILMIQQCAVGMDIEGNWIFLPECQAYWQEAYDNYIRIQMNIYIECIFNM